MPPSLTPETAERRTAPVLVLGIDPGTTCGLSLWDAAACRIVSVESAPFLRALDFLFEHTPPATCQPLALVVVEDARTLPIYARHGKVTGGERDRLARRVGYTDALAEQVLLQCAEYGLPAESRPPVRGAKWTADELRRLTGWSAPTNEHGRDAARHVVGLTVADVTARLAHLTA